MKEIRLNLASGATKLRGFINGDIKPFSDLEGITHIDMNDPLPYESESVSIVLMSHFLSLCDFRGNNPVAFPKSRKAVLSEVYRVLKKGGYFRIDDNPDRLWTTERGWRIVNNFPESMLLHRDDLKKMLEQVGFVNIREIDPETTTITTDKALATEIIRNKGWHESFTLEMEK